MRKEMTVEGYTVVIELGDQGKFVITIPRLPGVIGQVKEEKDAVAEIRRLIGAHFEELASRRPHKKGGMTEDGEGGHRKTRMGRRH